MWKTTPKEIKDEPRRRWTLAKPFNFHTLSIPTSNANGLWAVRIYNNIIHFNLIHNINCSKIYSHEDISSSSCSPASTISSSLSPTDSDISTQFPTRDLHTPQPSYHQENERIDFSGIFNKEEVQSPDSLVDEVFEIETNFDQQPTQSEDEEDVHKYGQKLLEVINDKGLERRTTIN
jgi:hypothetical protein